ncbi:MAG: alpha/beta hydrolase [Candidatus Thorarchaeota archaeon]|nr:alpha/beta hydrolase [Candidatus Thorarchaeota archaeon]
MHILRRLDRNKQFLILCLLLICSSTVLANAIQSNFGSIDVEYIRIVDENGMAITGKLYRPIAATDDNPAPGVLLLHGMNNDKDTEGPAALELARRGIVALAIDELSHGDSDRIVDIMGYFTGTFDSTLGGNAAYQWLKSLSFVDETQTGLVGHSMGAGTASAIAEMNPDHRAIVIQADGPYNLTTHSYMNNYLAVWSFYEELFTTQPRVQFLQDSLEMIAYNENLSSAEDAQADFTYGTFSDGSAHRYAKCPCTHPGATWNAKGISETTAWILQALSGMSETEARSLSAISTQTYMIREGATLFTLIVAFISIIPLASILLEIPYFSKIVQPIPKKVPTQGKKWWMYATINSLIGGITFLILPMVGMILGALLGAYVPIFLLVTGNGLLLWFLVNALIALIFFRVWFKKVSASEEGITDEDVGRFKTIRDPESRDILFRTILLSIVLVLFLYVLVAVSQQFLGIEVRYMWPIFKEFTPTKFGQFIVNIFPVLPFFLINGGVFTYGMIKQPESDSQIKTQMIWWIKIVFAMESTLLVLILVNYLPMFLIGTGPVLSMGLYGIFLMAYLPLFAGIFFVMTALYIKTGRIYLGGIVATLLVVWIMTAGMII